MKTELLNHYQIVILDCPYHSIQNQLVQSLFSKFIAAKLSGYMKEYPYGVLPFGAYDLVGTLLLLCNKLPGDQLEPIMVFKSTSLERCKNFNLPFEGLELFKDATTQEHKNVVLEIIKSATNRGVNLGYNSSWTIQKNIRENKELVHFVRELSVMMLVNYYTSYQINEILIGGAVRFKVDKLQVSIGFKYLQTNETQLPPIDCPFLFGEKTAVMHLAEFSEEAKRIATLYRDLWEAKLVLENLGPEVEKDKIAA